ncbi:hypothetical protein ABZV31_32755 [Streptomyces sp. NPDC005202]|uniref:hypothetical protein n=1 Tax=Streptomyces sp. NPDC005202 TaxID=3157021 RepID=UPI0033BCB55B
MNITGCRFHTEDDSIAVKPGRDEDGLRVGVLTTNKQRGGAIDGVYVRRFTGRQIDRDCIYLTTRYAGQTGDRPAVIRNVHVQDMVHDGARRAINLEGLDSDRFQHIRIEHCDFTDITEPDVIESAPDLVRKKVFVNGTEVTYP